MKLPPTFRTGGDSTYLLDVLNSRVRPDFVFDQQILPRFRVLFGFCAFAEVNLVVFLIVLEIRSVSMSPLNTIAVLVGVVAFAVARRVRAIIGLAFLIPRVKAFSKLLQNSLTGQ